MILRTLGVEGWRCFANRVEIGPLSSGINVLHGPNGSGKSTLLGALVRGLFDNHAGAAKPIQSLRPWNRDLNPAVTIAFEHQGETYSLTKRFLGGACAELSRQEQGAMVRLAEGPEANRRVREMLAGEAPGRGATSAEHWGIGQVLWASQKGIALEPFSDGMQGAIQTALGAALSGGGQLENRVSERYHEIYTPGGQLRGGAGAPPAVGLEKRLEESRQRREALQARLQQYETASRRAEDFRNRRDQAAREARQRQQDLEAAGKRAQQYREALAARDRHQAEAAAAEARYSEIKQRIDGLKAARQELAEAEKELERADGDLPALASQVAACRAELDSADARVEGVRSRRAEVIAAGEQAEHAARFVEQRRRLAETDDLIRRIDAAQKHVDGLRERRSEICAPGAETLKAVQAEINSRHQAQSQLDAALITVRIDPEQAVELDVLHGEETGCRRLQPGQPGEVKGSPVVAFRVPGVGVFRASGPTGSVEEFRSRIVEASRKIETLTRDFGTSDPDELQALCDRAAAADAELGEARATLKALLGKRQADDLRQEKAASALMVEAVLRQYALWAESPPDAEALRIEAKRIEQAFMRDIDEGEARQKQSQKAFNLASQKHVVHEANVRQSRQRVGDLRRRLELLVADGKDDAQREAELGRLSIQWHAAQAQVKEAGQQLQEFGADPAKDVQVLEKQVRHLEKAESEFNEKFHAEQGSLQTLANEAPYSALAEVEETIQELGAAIARERLRYHAIRLLHQRIQEHRRQINEAVLSPVTQLATATLQRIAGPRLGTVEFGPDFLPQAVTPAAAGERVELAELCGGEQEQIYFAVRLALAEVLFPKERQLVVLDDVLTYTDSGRLARVLAILEEAAARFQILILTCHPEKYAGMAEACFIDLERAASGQATGAI